MMTEVNPNASPQVSELQVKRRWAFWLAALAPPGLAAPFVPPFVVLILSPLWFVLVFVSQIVSDRYYATRRPDVRRSGEVAFFVRLARLLGFTFLFVLFLTAAIAICAPSINGKQAPPTSFQRASQKVERKTVQECRLSNQNASADTQED